MSNERWLAKNGEKQASNAMGELTGRTWREAKENGTLRWNEAGNPVDNDESELYRRLYPKGINHEQ